MFELQLIVLRYNDMVAALELMIAAEMTILQTNYQHMGFKKIVAINRNMLASSPRGHPGDTLLIA